ncbi:MAG: DUF11 domain-containing protein, partial [Aquabacterium sp.]
KNKNLKTEKLTIQGGPAAFLITNFYDNNDALSAVRFDSETTDFINYAPDAFGRPTSAKPFITSMLFHQPSGQVTSMAYANGVVTTVELNALRLWPDRIQHALPVANALYPKALFDTQFRRDAVGNIEEIFDYAGLFQYRLMEYDNLDRLRKVGAGLWGNGVISYDGAGNIIGQLYGSSFLGYTYDSATNRLMSTSGPKTYQFQYDNYGNVISNGQKDFTYNHASNLTCVNCSRSDEVSYAYDGLGLRVSEKTGNKTTYYMTDSDGQMMLETDGQVTRRYAYVLGKQVAVDQVSPASAPDGKLGGSAALRVAVTSDKQTAQTGNQITYTVVVTNSSSQAAADVKISDPLPSGITFVSASAGCTHADGIVTCALGSVAANSSTTVQIVARAKDVTTLPNVVVVTSATPNTAPIANTYGEVAVPISKGILTPEILLLLLGSQ